MLDLSGTGWVLLNAFGINSTGQIVGFLRTIGNSNARKHGRYTAKAIARRRELAALVLSMRGLVEEVDC